MPRSLPPVAADAAFFIDFDGTLVDIADRPDLVVVQPSVRRVLEALIARFDDAVAVVTGRPLAAIDGYLAPLRMPVAAEHGSIRRDAKGCMHAEMHGAEAVESAVRALEPFVKYNPGLLLEQKQASVALHFRQRPDLAADCATAVEKARAAIPELGILAGKMVYELRPEGIHKGTAIKAFMEEAPFRGRVPVYAGDDVTDEHGFAAVNELGGISIKIGEETTTACYRADREILLAWLERAVSRRQHA